VHGNVEEIITYMNSRFRTYEVFERQLRNITRELMERGYTLDEIVKGINAYLLQLEPQSTDSRQREKNLSRARSFRVLDESEARRIGPGAQGYLWLMREMGMLNPQECEEIITYILENELEVESGEQLQGVMMDLILDQDAEREGLIEASDFSGFDDFEDQSLRPLQRRRLN